MQTSREFTIKDLVKTPSQGYANFEGENRVFMLFNTVSPQMMKLKENAKFIYKGKTYRIVMRMPPDENRPKNIQLNCLKINKVSDKNNKKQ